MPTPLPTEAELRGHPFDTYPVYGGTIWFDPDNNAFYLGSPEPDGCDDAVEYQTYDELAAGYENHGEDE